MFNIFITSIIAATCMMSETSIADDFLFEGDFEVNTGKQKLWGVF